MILPQAALTFFDTATIKLLEGLGLSNPSLTINMKSKFFYLIAITAVLTTCIFVGAFVTADKTRYRNSFIRVFPPHAADEYKVAGLRYKASIAGISNEAFYLRYGSELAQISHDMLDTCKISIKNPEGYEITIDSPYFTIQSGAFSILRRGNIHDWSVDTTLPELPAFTAAQPITKSIAILQVIDLDLRKNIFVKTNKLEKRNDILKKQVDGIFCTDGFLMYSKKENMLIYVYRYRNEIICMDTSLNVLRTFNTIDTTTVAKIEVAEAGGKITMSKPPFVVNKSACVDGSNLFVQSNLVARNEVIDDIKNKSVVDVYNIKDGSYRFSFYIADRDKRKLESFKVKDSILIAKFPLHIARYDLVSKYLKQ